MATIVHRPLCIVCLFTIAAATSSLAAPAATSGEPFVLADTIFVAPILECITIADTCRTASVEILRTSATDARGASVTFALSPELQICDPSASISINQGDWLSAFEPNIFFAVNDNQDGTFTVDQSILGQPCGVTTGGTLFTVDIRKTSGFSDSTGTITITAVAVSDCSSVPIPTVPGPPKSITIDTTPPPAITGISATQVTAGNDADGTTKITIAFDPPGPDVAAVEVWRAPYGNYPEYDDPPGAGSLPALPSLYPPSQSDPRWVLTPVTASGQTDEPSTRDYWYYIAISKDACGNPTLPGALSGSLGYHLGDVTPTEIPGDNQVNFFDISRLGTCYFAALDPSDPCGDTDVAPPGPDGPPATDNLVGFEDLLVFATNFEQVGMRQPAPQVVEGPTPRLELTTKPAGEKLVRAELRLVDNATTVKGLHAVVALADAVLIDLERGELLGSQASEVFFAHLPGTDVVIDAAVLGRGVVIEGSGVVASMLLRADGDRVARLAEVDLRDAANRPLGDVRSAAAAVDLDGAERSIPARYELLGARPNPFNPSTEIRFRLPAETRVALRVYDAGGRLIRTLADVSFPAGEHAISWDGRDHRGQSLSSGVYFYTLRAGEIDAVEKLLLIK